MSNRKAAANYSSSTFARKRREGKLPWTKLFGESVQVLMNPHISDRARALWLLMQPILGEHDGYLLDLNREPHTPDTLARVLYGRGHVDTDLRKLIQYGALSEDNKIIFCPMMVKDTGKVLEGTSGNKVGVAKCHDDLVTVSRGSADFNSERVDEIRVEDTSSPLNGEEEVDSTLNNKNQENSRVAAPRRRDPLFPGLTEKDLATVREEFPHLEFDHVYAEFVRVNTAKGTEKANLKWLRGFFERHRPDKETPSASESRAAELSAEDEEIKLARLPRLELVEKRNRKGRLLGEVLMLGGKPISSYGPSEEDFLNMVRNMSLRSPEKSKQFLFKLIGKEWNYQTAIDLELIEGYREDDEGNPLWQGSDYVSEADKERERLEGEEEAKAAAVAKKAQEEAASARKEAERVRKEREEKERQEREKQEAIMRKQEAQEREKREAEQREEEKEFNKKFNPAFSLIISNGERETVTEATWTSLGFGFTKDRFMEYLKQKRISESTISAVIAAFEQNGLAWWEEPAA